jgi:arginase family enzyme
LVFDSKECEVERLDEIQAEIQQYFKQKPNHEKNWISFDIDGVDSSEFKSTGTDEGNGLSLDFTMKLFEKMVPKSVGMDFTEVNFTLTEGKELQQDKETFRDLMELICHQVN